jgi:hypothetical protein
VGVNSRAIFDESTLPCSLPLREKCRLFGDSEGVTLWKVKHYPSPVTEPVRGLALPDATSSHAKGDVSASSANPLNAKPLVIPALVAGTQTCLGYKARTGLVHVNQKKQPPAAQSIFYRAI